MSHRSVIAIVTILAAGGLGLALMPGPAKPEIASVEPPHPVSQTGAASPKLLKTLNDELAPPKATAPVVPVQVATAGPAPTASALAPAAALAAPAAPASDSLRGDRIGPSAVNMRAGPSSGAATLSVLPADQPVQVSEVTNGWAHVTLADGTTGWVYGTYLANGVPNAPSAQPRTSTTATTTTTAQTRVASTQARAVIRGSAGDLEDRIAHVASHLTAYARPMDSAQSVFTLEPGDEVRIAEVRGDWLRVETEDGIMAWIRRAR